LVRSETWFRLFKFLSGGSFWSLEEVSLKGSLSRMDDLESVAEGFREGGKLN
jgi:hypothetical protein